MKMVRDASSSLLYGDSNTTTNSTFEKKLKLFGFEISETTQQQQQSLSPTMICDETINHEKMLLNDGEESTNSSNTVSSGGGRDNHHNNHKNDGTSSVISNIEVEGDQKRYECQYCFKEFANSQALGGHQNAHKKERLKKKRLQLQAKKASINFYLHQQPYYSHYQNCQNMLNSKSASGTQQWYFDRSYNNNNNNNNHTVVPLDDHHQYASIYEESQISFGPFDQDQDRHHQTPTAAFHQQQFTLTHTNTSNSNAASRCTSEDTPTRHVVIKPSPLPVSKQSCKSLDLQLGLC